MQADEALGHPDDQGFSEEIHRRMGAGEVDHCSFEKRYVIDDERVIWTRVDVSAVEGDADVGRFFVAHVRDVTKRKRAEEEARLSANRFSEAFSNAPVGMALRSLEGHSVWVNRAMQQMLGYPADHYSGSLLTNMVHPDDLRSVNDELPGLLTGAKDSVLRDLRLVHADGRILHGQVHLSVVRDATGEPQYVISQVVDITARKRAESELHQRAEFDRVVTALATNFINLPIDRVDTGVVRALEQVARFVGANRAAVVLYRDDTSADVGLRHEWAAPGLDSIRAISGVHVWDFMAASLLAGQTVFENDLVEDPPVRDKTRDYLVDQGIRAFVAVPFDGGRQAGLIGFSSSSATQWDVERLALLRIGAEMISNVLERRVADHILRESGERLQQMADNVQTLFWVCKPENLEFVYASKGLATIFDPAPTATLDQAAMIRRDRMIHPDDFQLVVDGFSRGCKQRTSYEYRLRCHDGEVRWLRTRCFPVPDGDGETALVAGVTDDITEEKHFAEELAYHARFERLISELATGFIDVPVEAVDDGIERALRLVGEFAGVDIAYFTILATDHSTLGDSFAWTSAQGAPYRGELNQFTLADYPWTRAQLERGERIHVADVETDFPEAARSEQLAARAVDLRSCVTYPIIRKGELVAMLGFSSLGEPKRWTEEALAIVDVVVTMFANVLERRRTEQELAHRAEFERLIGHLAMDLVNLPDAELDDGLVGALRELAAFTGFHTVSIFQIDAGGRTISCTHEWASRPSAERFEAVQNIAISDMQWGVSHLSTRTSVHAVRVSELPPEAQAERELLERIGVRFTVRVALFGSSGQRGFVAFSTGSDRPGVNEDIFASLRIAAELLANALERRRAERAVHEHQAELAHTLRLGTMGELAPWLAHELNQPLSAISSFARGCQRRLASGNVDIAELMEVTEQMSRQAMRAGEVVQSLRRHVRKQEPRREWYAINELVSSALALVRPEALELGVEIVTYFDTEPSWVQVDPIQTEQVVLNLVRNGFDAMSNGTAETKQIHVATRCADAFVEVSVTDSGAGFETADADALFEAFSSTKSSGLGLGLSLSRSIVEAHGGRIWGESVKGEGATFAFTVPRTVKPR